ncbi:MAG: YebC/PmpR family DNA-binding transcriptional regulator [Clostridia bacterium]
MSGHSKWANIKRKKEATDNKRGKVFSRMGKEITIIVKSGGPDPSINGKLRDIVAKAKAANMPGDNIQRCIQKAAGSGDSVSYEEITYEGYGPNGIAVIVEALTDNKNRAAADIRCIFDRSGGKMGLPGCVGFMFAKKGVLIIEKDEKLDEETVMMDALDSGAEDFAAEEEYFEVTTDPVDFSKVLAALEEKGYKFLEAEIKMVPSVAVDVTEEQADKFQVMLDKLDDNDDVQNVWHNADM